MLNEHHLSDSIHKYDIFYPLVRKVKLQLVVWIVKILFLKSFEEYLEDFVALDVDFSWFVRS